MSLPCLPCACNAGFSLLTGRTGASFVICWCMPNKTSPAPNITWVVHAKKDITSTQHHLRVHAVAQALAYASVCVLHSDTLKLRPKCAALAYVRNLHILYEGQRHDGCPPWEKSSYVHSDRCWLITTGMKDHSITVLLYISHVQCLVAGATDLYSTASSFGLPAQQPWQSSSASQQTFPPLPPGDPYISS